MAQFNELPKLAAIGNHQQGVPLFLAIPDGLDNR